MIHTLINPFALTTLCILPLLYVTYTLIYTSNTYIKSEILYAKHL
jgi:hypothetical protein